MIGGYIAKGEFPKPHRVVPFGPSRSTYKQMHKKQWNKPLLAKDRLQKGVYSLSMPTIVWIVREHMLKKANKCAVNLRHISHT
jgi:hypothetical protein